MRHIFSRHLGNHQKSASFGLTKGEERRRGTDLYIDPSFGDSKSPGGFFETLGEKYPFLHDEYYKVFSDRKRWIRWLCENFGLSTLPRLVTPVRRPRFKFSNDFKYILEKCQISDVLRQLRNNWDHYSRWIEEKEDGDESSEYQASKTKVREELANTKVQCRTAKFPLGRTMLPLIDVDMDEIPHLPV